jgi:hypothetical protein
MDNHQSHPPKLGTMAHYKTKSKNGNDSVVHYVKDPKTGKLMDFKFKKHSTGEIPLQKCQSFGIEESTILKRPDEKGNG